MVSISLEVETVSAESQAAPLRPDKRKDPGLEEGFENGLGESEEKAFALSLTWEGYATLDAEDLRKVIYRHWSR